MSIESAMPSNHLILCVPFILPPSVFPSIRVFSNESVLHIRWPKLQSFPASGSFLMSQFFTSGGQSIGASALSSVLPVNIQGWFPLALTGLISLLSKGLLIKESSQAPQFESINSLVLSFLYGPSLMSVHDYWENPSFDYTDLCKQSYVSTF